MFKHAQFETVQAYIANPAHAGLALHARVQRALRQLILDGALSPGKPLPASRALARSLGLSRDTVETAYAQLHAEGFITRRAGSGSFVSEKADFPLHRPPARNPFHHADTNVSGRGAAIIAAGGVREQLIPRPFAPGIPETRSFPIGLWERLQRQVLKEFGARALQHGDPQGFEPLRRAIADYVNLERGAHADAERVIVLTSSQQAFMLCATVLLDHGDNIFIEDPVYYGARKAFEAANVECIPIAVDGDGMRVDQLCALPGRAKAVYLTPSHQFPTGATLTLERRLAVIDWAAKHQAWIIEDDYDSEFHYAGRPNACVQGLDPHHRTIYIGTFTKSLFPGLRLAYMVLPPALVKPMTIARTLMDGHTASVNQITLTRFIEGGHFGAYIRTMRHVYSERLSILDSAVKRHLSGIVEPRMPQGGLQMPCLLGDGHAERETIGAAKRAGIDLLSLSDLYHGQSGTPGWLMGFAAYTPDEIESAVRKFATMLKR